MLAGNLPTVNGAVGDVDVHGDFPSIQIWNCNKWYFNRLTKGFSCVILRALPEKDLALLFKGQLREPVASGAKQSRADSIGNCFNPVGLAMIQSGSL